MERSKKRDIDQVDQEGNDDSWMKHSGSAWGPKHTGYFNVVEVQTDEQLFEHSDVSTDDAAAVQLNHDAITALEKVCSLQRTPFSQLMSCGAMGPFLCLMARITEVPDIPPSPRTEHERSAKRVKTFAEVSTDDDGRERSATGDSEYDDKESHASTTKSVHFARTKPEVPTQSAIFLFALGVFECSTLREEELAPHDTESWRLEWDISPKSARIESGKVVCTSNSDGSLLLKGFGSDGYWGQKDDLAYCLVEVSVPPCSFASTV